MSRQTIELYVPGPMHPDLFDGETPIQLPVEIPPRLFQVEVSFSVTKRRSRRVTLAATSEAEAARVAVEWAEDDADDSEDDFEVEEVEDLATEPGDEELQAWLARQEAIA